jgi:hypothetical protein
MHKLKGFSLIEILCFITLVSVLLILLFTLVVFCKRVAGSVEGYSEQLSSLRMANDIVRNSLSRAIRVASPCFSDRNFVGEATKISLIGPIDIGDRRDIYCQLWSYEPRQKRLEVLLINPKTGLRVSPPQEVISRVQSVEFRYCSSSKPVSAEKCNFFWSRSGALPKIILVRIALIGPLKFPDMTIEVESRNVFDI